jgi:Transposase, Mutator family
MALDDSALSELLSRLTEADSADVFREVLRLGLQALVEAEATAHIGAGRHERTPARTTRRNGGRQRVVSTPAGDVTVRIRKDPHRFVLPFTAGAAPARGPGAVGGDHGGLRARGVHAQGRRPGRRAGGGQRRVEVDGVAHLRRA